MCSALGALGLTGATAGATPISRRPNILFVLADDWGWTSSRAIDELGMTLPNFERVKRAGLTFTNAFCAAPTCTASRGAILTGRAPWQLEEGANLASILPKKFGVYPDMLEAAGYVVGFADKGWAPGQLKPVGRTRNPAGDRYADFPAFMDKRQAGTPFCFWLGTHDPHRPYVKGQGRAHGVTFDGPMLPYLPDAPEIREDIADYMYAVERFDRILGVALDRLEASGEADNTLVVVTGDNGPSFTHSKATLYDAGSHVPMAVSWPGKVKPGTVTDALVVLTDLAPTFLQVAGLKPTPEMTGKSLVPLLKGGRLARDAVVTAMERHMDGHTEPGSGYPMRALRTDRYLFIRNFHPERWPAGDPPRQTPSADRLEKDNYAGFADIGPGPTKAFLVLNQADPKVAPYFALATRKRPPRELYDIKADPYQLRDLSGDPRYAARLKALDQRLEKELVATADPRVGKDPDVFDHYPSYSDPGFGRPEGF